MFTSWEEIDAFNILLNMDKDAVTRMRNQNTSIQGAANKVLDAFYDSEADETARWGALVEALKEIGKARYIVEFGIDKLLHDAQGKMSIYWCCTKLEKPIRCH